MSDREYAINLLNQVPESKLIYVISYLQGALIPDEYETPNQDTAKAIAQVNEMVKTGGGQHFEGSTKDFMQMMLEE